MLCWLPCWLLRRLQCRLLAGLLGRPDRLLTRLLGWLLGRLLTWLLGRLLTRLLRGINWLLSRLL